MSKLLYIQASPRGEQSKSITAADAFISEYLKTHLDDQIETVNVFDPAIPEFDAPAVQAKYKILQGQEHSAEDSKAWKDVEKVIEQFKSADKYVLALPMWNFSIPYRLKLYIDILVQPGYTFTYSEDTGYQGLVIGKPILAVYARGGEYPEGSEAEAFDLQKKYIELIFGFMGFENIRSVVIEPTLQGGPEVAEARLREAVEKAKELAAVF
jgi:FMN-dependent NADH-azoreductase